MVSICFGNLRLTKMEMAGGYYQILGASKPCHIDLQESL
jgi:hypothetical protein